MLMTLVGFQLNATPEPASI